MIRLEESGPRFSDGAVRSVLYLDCAMSRAQEALILLVVILGSTITYRIAFRHSGMPRSYGNLATLSTAATAEHSFLESLSNTMDVEEGKARS